MRERNLQCIFELAVGDADGGLRFGERRGGHGQIEPRGQDFDTISCTEGESLPYEGILFFDLSVRTARMVRRAPSASPSGAGRFDARNGLCLNGDQLRRGFIAPCRSLTNWTFVAMENRQLKSERHAPFARPLIPLVARAEMKIGLLLRGFERQSRLPRTEFGERCEHVGARLQRLLSRGRKRIGGELSARLRHWEADPAKRSDG